MAAAKGRSAMRGPSSPDLGQERPSDRVRPTTVLDLGVREELSGGSDGIRRPPMTAYPRG